MVEGIHLYLANLVGPELKSLIVIFINTNPQSVWWQTKPEKVNESQLYLK